MTAISHVIFDLGGVLVHVGEERVAREWAALCGRSPAEVRRAVFSPERKRPLESGRQTWDEFSAAVRAELGLDVTHDEFTRVFRTVLTPNEPIYGLVRELGRHYSLGCCSNTSGPHWDEMQVSVPVVELFDPRVISCEVGHMKPGPEIYRTLAEQCGAAPERILFIDDVQRNVEGARDAGIAAMRFTGVDALRSDLRSMGVEMKRERS